MKLSVVTILSLLFFPLFLFSQPLSAIVEAKGNISCFGLQDGYVTILATGGAGPYSFELNSSGIAQSDRTINQLGPGIHSVRIRDASFNFVDVGFEILEPSPVEVEVVERKDVECYGGNNGEVLLSARGGTGNYTYGIDQNSFSSSPSFKSLSAGPYNFMVKDENECLDDSLVFVSSPQAVKTFVSQKRELSCFGQTDGRIELLSSGGWGEYQYSLDSVHYQTQAVFSGFSKGSYKIFTIDTVGCTHQLEVLFEEPDSLIQLISKEDLSCFGTNDGQITLSAMGGKEPYYYSINNSQFASPNQFVGLGPGQYMVSTRDINGCESETQQIEIAEPPRLMVSATSKDVSCKGGEDGEASVDIQGGIAPYKISWNDSETLNSPTLNSLPAGNYFVVVEDQNGCNETTFIQLTEPDVSLELELLEIDPAICSKSNGQISLVAQNAQGNISYQWSHDPSLQGTIASSLPAGNYEVFAVDSMGCEAYLMAELPKGRTVMADFHTFPDINSNFTALQGEISFINTSRSASTFQWDFGDGIGFSTDPNPRYTYQNPGYYEINLIARDDQGICIDTIRQSIRIQSDEWVELPDAFSPDGDGVNDVFLAVGSGIQSFEISFFDQWGRTIVESTSIRDGWDGRDRKGRWVRPGVYAYKMRTVFNSGFVLERAGGVILLR